MMYDFHYPSGRGKLNEDTVNCRAEQPGMMGGGNASPGYFFQFSVFSLLGEKEIVALPL